LLSLPGIDTEPDRQAIFDFAALNYIPAPETFYKGVRALQPGEILVAQLDGARLTYRNETYHQWEITPDPSLTLSKATNHAETLLETAVSQQMESDVPLATLLSGGIDSSLVSFAAQKALKGELQTFNVRFQDKEFDETWAAVAMAKFIDSQHQTLDILEGQGTWDHITGLLQHAGQPFADTSYFAVNAVCHLLREHVAVALSGDGGDEAFGGYNVYSALTKITRWQLVPTFLRRLGSGVSQQIEGLEGKAGRWANHFGNLIVADDTSMLQYLFSWVREKEHNVLCRDSDLLPLRRLYEPHWKYHFPKGVSRLERLSAHATEINVRMRLTNDYLFKVDTASMRESLEVRVPFLDENLFAFGLSLPHSLKVEGRNCKRVLREISKTHLPQEIANKRKMGFGIPVDNWVDHDFKIRLREEVLGSTCCLQEYFQPGIYRPIIKAFCEGRSLPNISRQGQYQRVIMLLAVYLALESNTSKNFDCMNSD
jgi:asparagine synthase (glutamine-hydrolysing)